MPLTAASCSSSSRPRQRPDGGDNAKPTFREFPLFWVCSPSCPCLVLCPPPSCGRKIVAEITRTRGDRDKRARRHMCEWQIHLKSRRGSSWKVNGRFCACPLKQSDAPERRFAEWGSFDQFHEPRLPETVEGSVPHSTTPRSRQVQHFTLLGVNSVTFEL